LFPASGRRTFTRSIGVRAEIARKSFPVASATESNAVSTLIVRGRAVTVYLCRHLRFDNQLRNVFPTQRIRRRTTARAGGRRSEDSSKIRKLTRPPVSSAIRGRFFHMPLLTKFAPMASRVSDAK